VDSDLNYDLRQTRQKAVSFESHMKLYMVAIMWQCRSVHWGNKGSRLGCFYSFLGKKSKRKIISSQEKVKVAHLI